MAVIEHKDIVGADAVHPIWYEQTSDPGSVGAGKLWLDTTGGATLTAGAILKRRNAGNAAWDTIADVATALALKANLASPTFTGTVTIPTPTAADSSTKAASTAFVQGELASYATTTALALKAPLASPTFTGTPAAPTASPGTNTTQVATTAFVAAAVTAGSGAPTSAQYLALATDATLTAERVFTPSTRFSATDGGAGSTYTLDLTNNLRDVALPFVIDGGGSAITTGVKGDVEIPFSGTIVSARLFADQSGSIVLDLWKDTYTNYPATVADTITASAKPTLSSAAKSQDTTLTGWTTSVTAGDVLRVNVDSASTLTRCTLSLVIRRS